MFGTYREKAQQTPSSGQQNLPRPSQKPKNDVVPVRRLLQAQHAEEAAATEQRRLRDLEAATAEAAAAQAERQLGAEIAAMALEDQRSREVEAEKRAAETALREREAYLRDLYTSFVPLWGEETSDTSAAGAPRGEGEGEEGGLENRRGVWWTGADAPKNWGGPSVPWPRLSKASPGPRFVPHAQALLDSLEPQHVSLGRLSREYLALLDLPHDSIRDMYDQVSTRPWKMQTGTNKQDWHTDN